MKTPSMTTSGISCSLPLCGGTREPKLHADIIHVMNLWAHAVLCSIKDEGSQSICVDDRGSCYHTIAESFHWRIFIDKWVLCVPGFISSTYYRLSWIHLFLTKQRG